MINSKFNRPTIRDVAREAGVSYQTVSRVLNKQPRVSADTRRRVLAAIDKLGYQRNLAAQMLTTHREQMTATREAHLGRAGAARVDRRTRVKLRAIAREEEAVAARATKRSAGDKERGA